MHAQLELLLQIQDLKSQRRELADLEGSGGMEQVEFNVDVDEALRLLDEKITDMKGELEPRIRSRLEHLASTGGRAVVPLINGTCYGCFTMLPTASLRELSSHDQVQACENCGRFLYSIAP